MMHININIRAIVNINIVNSSSNMTCPVCFTWHRRRSIRGDALLAKNTLSVHNIWIIRQGVLNMVWENENARPRKESTLVIRVWQRQELDYSTFEFHQLLTFVGLLKHGIYHSNRFTSWTNHSCHKQKHSLFLKWLFLEKTSKLVIWYLLLQFDH